MTEANIEAIEEFFNHLRSLSWPVRKSDEHTILLGSVEPISIIKKISSDKFELNFAWYSRVDSKYGSKEDFKLRFDSAISILGLIYLNRRGYSLSYEPQVRSILQISSQGRYREDVDILDIGESYRRIVVSKSQRVIKVPYTKYLEIYSDASETYKRSKSYKDSIERYLVNEYSRKNLKIDIKHVTTIKKGEFEFLVNRLNLETKEKKKDFESYIGNNDIEALQKLFSLLIKNELFSPDYIRLLDDYFIKEKLKNIILIGQKVLSLKSSDLNTKEAKKIKKLIGITSVKQLENLWQKYFEKYLLYLIFSYKEIYPKVQFKVESEKKYPDFIGINHYYGVDAIEIKTHLTPALVWDSSHKNYAFSPDLSKAIIQVVNYTDAIKREGFKNKSDQQKITGTTHKENLYRPRGIIVISSSGRLTRNPREGDADRIQRDFTKLRNSLHNIEILTFDEILEIANSYQRNIAEKST